MTLLCLSSALTSSSAVEPDPTSATMSNDQLQNVLKPAATSLLSLDHTGPSAWHSSSAFAALREHSCRASATCSTARVERPGSVASRPRQGEKLEWKVS